MSEIVIIGNGFDLTAGLKSSYTDFFSWREEELIKNPDLKTIWDVLFDWYKAPGVLPSSITTWSDVEKGIEHFLISLEFDVSIQMVIENYVESLTMEESQTVDGKIKSAVQSYIHNQISDMIWNRYLVEEFIDILKSRYVNPNETSGPSPAPESFERTLDRLGDLLSIGSADMEEKFRDLFRKEYRDTFLHYYKDELTLFEKSFAKYMKHMTNGNGNYMINAVSLVDKVLGPSYERDGTVIMNFNYTMPSWQEEIMDEGISFRSVHGDLDHEDIIFGIDSFNSNEAGPYAPFTKTYRTLSFTSSKKDVPKIDAMSVNTIKFFGHSLGEQDYSYFMALFDEADLYNSNTQLIFYFNDYPGKLIDEIRTEVFDRVTTLMTAYGKTLDNKDHGKNLLHKLILERRIFIDELTINKSV